MITTPIDTDLVHGAADLERTARGLRPHRLPAWVRERFPDPQLLMVEAHPSGVRLVFTTTARTVELVTHTARVASRGADRPRGRVDLVVDGEVVAGDRLTGGDVIETDLQTGTFEHRPGEDHTSAFGGLADREKLVEIWLPHNESVELVGLRTDAPVRAVPTNGPVWLHHGSSISHGSNAAGPTDTWPAVAARTGTARAGGVALRNLGLGGSALVDPFTAQVMRDAPADLISVKLGINTVNLDGMRLRTFVPAVHGFLDTIRDGHPDVPLVLVSPIFCGIHEDAPGPAAVDPATLGTDQVRFAAGQDDGTPGRLTLRVIRDAFRSLVERRADKALHLLDGTTLYGEADAADHPLPDALHPDTATHRLIGERFAAYAFAPGGPFAGA